MGTTIMNYKQQIGLVLAATTMLVAVWMGLDLIKTKYGNDALSYTFTGVFGILTILLMIKNLLVWLDDQQASVWWLTAMLTAFCFTVMSISRLTNYFNIH